jgi:hypothetical protein
LCFERGVHKKFLLVLISIALVFHLSGCVSMSPQARRERAYRHYVQKQIKKRQRETARAQKAANRDLKRKMKSMQPGEPQVTTGVQEAPQSWSEPVTPPVTVSASDSITTQNADQPSQP